MHDSEITIFYSWQSDLPGSETRNLIQDGIKDAVKLLRDTVDIEADRDTQGEFGSPDIAQTIFSKIDKCDIFIADVSAVCRYETTDKDGNVKVKLMPNPNVMLELGYATHVVGWENVICILNSDYGAPDNMPFDIANRRLTTFSLSDGKSKGEVYKWFSMKKLIRTNATYIDEIAFFQESLKWICRWCLSITFTYLTRGALFAIDAEKCGNAACSKST